MAKGLSTVTKLSDFGSYAKSLDISHGKLHLKSKLNFSDDNIIVNSTALTNKYWDYIINATYKITLTDEEFIEYRYQPKKYCYRVFGTTELWSLLLKVNNMISVAEFNTKSFLTFNDNIFTILNEILILEDDAIAENNASL